MITKYNRLMKALLESKKGSVYLGNQTGIEQCIDKLFTDVVFENDCLFMKMYNGQAAPEFFSDMTEFEASQNEILINSEFSKERITAAFALEFFDRFNKRLPDICSKKICSVMSEDNGRWTFRFHIVREDEPLWVSEDIEGYSQPVMYAVFDGAS